MEAGMLKTGPGVGVRERVGRGARVELGGGLPLGVGLGEGIGMVPKTISVPNSVPTIFCCRFTFIAGFETVWKRSPSNFLYAFLKISWRKTCSVLPVANSLPLGAA